MKHVAKQDWMGCAVATVAMLADLTYDEVAIRLSLPDLARTRSPKQMRALLEGATHSKWRLTTFLLRRPTLDRFSFPEWPIAVFLQDAPYRPRLGQWVVVKRDLVHDPDARIAYTVRKYPYRHWRISSLAQPRWPVPFAEEQARHRIARIYQVFQMEGLLQAAAPRASCESDVAKG
jgi:hypothetical protein